MTLRHIANAFFFLALAAPLQAEIEFEARLAQDLLNEACAIADFNQDGVLEMNEVARSLLFYHR